MPEGDQSGRVLTSLIAGEWMPAQADAVISRENPGNTKVTAARWSSATAVDATRAIDSAAQAAASWAAHPHETRLAILSGWLDRIEADTETLVTIITRENGKPRADALAEVAGTLKDARHSVQDARDRGLVESSHSRSHTRLEPVGPVLIVTPWNFPLATIVRKVTPALLYGNPIVIKPSELTPASAVAAVKLLEPDLPSGVVNLVLGHGAQVGPALTSHAALRAISFTGSTATGTALARATAARDVRLQLEMGGKNSLVVLADADVDAAVEAAITGGFGCAGQWCTGTGRVIVDHSIAETFLERLITRTRELKVGPGDSPESQVGPVISAARVNFATEAIATATAAGARLRCGGKLRPGGHFITPAVIDRVTEAMPIFTEELFVPVLPVIAARNADDAVRLANTGRYGLSASVFSRDETSAMRCAERIQAGMIHVNLHTAWRDPALPVSGWRDSGRGLPECGRFYRDFFTKPRAVYLP
ncbi:MAG: aldehyde dehydrogenase [Opitutaceae bacterium]|nr:aldehyde dehydrogenase [Opitutaceae bacterium]